MVSGLFSDVSKVVHDGDEESGKGSPDEARFRRLVGGGSIYCFLFFTRGCRNLNSDSLERVNYNSLGCK